MAFKETEVWNVNFNAWTRFEKQWALLTAGDESGFNAMTVSWGGVGVLWRKNVSFVFVRPQRYTFEFMEKNDYYSLSFLKEGNRKILSVCGSVSGRDEDKIKKTGLSPILDREAPYFEQAELVLVCRKMHGQYIDPSGFIDKSINNEYENGDYHKVYVGEIERCLVNGDE